MEQIVWARSVGTRRPPKASSVDPTVDQSLFNRDYIDPALWLQEREDLQKMGTDLSAENQLSQRGTCTTDDEFSSSFVLLVFFCAHLRISINIQSLFNLIAALYSSFNRSNGRTGLKEAMDRSVSLQWMALISEFKNPFHSTLDGGPTSSMVLGSDMR